MLCIRKFLESKGFMDKKGGVSILSFERFLSQFLEGFHRKVHECFNNLGYRKTLWIREELRESQFYLEIFLPHGTEKMRRRTLLCFTKSLVTKRLRIGEWGGDGGASRPSVERFCLTMPKTFVGELVSVSIISGIEKIHA